MTQPGVSQHIKKLENLLGRELLHRFGKQFELTDAGDHLLRYGQKLFHEEQTLIEHIRDDDKYHGECRLACSGAMAMQLYPEFLSLQQKHSGLTFALEAAPNAGILERISNNMCELGIVTQPVSDPSLKQEVLGEHELCLVLPAGTGLSWDNLLKLGFVNHPDGHHYAETLLHANFAARFVGIREIRQASYINQLSQILLPVSMGIGFTIVPRSSITAFPYPERLHTPLLDNPVTETMHLVSKKNRPLAKRYELVKEILYRFWR